jgi:membrane-associated phospholipid phosphatase
LVSEHDLFQAVTRLRRPWLTPLVVWYSRLGNHGALWVGWGGWRAVKARTPRPLVEAALVTWSALGVNYAIKRVARRSRPTGAAMPAALITAPASPSFPSSHAAMSAAAALTLRGLAPVAALPMMLSRVYLGVHYPSDVAAGALVGSIWGALIAGIQAS